MHAQVNKEDARAFAHWASSFGHEKTAPQRSAVFVAFCEGFCYSSFCKVLPRRWAVAPPFPEGEFVSFPLQTRGGEAMITYSELFQFCMVLLGVATFVWTVASHSKKK